MRRKAIVLLLLALAGCKGHRSAQGPRAYPAAAEGAVVDTYHGTAVADPYRWLEDENSPETRAWIEAQNKMTRKYLDDLPGRSRIRERLETLWNFERFGVPSVAGGRYFYARNDGLQNQYVLLVAEAVDAEPRILLDPNAFSPDGTVSLSGRWPSPDGKLLAYALSKGGSDLREIFVRDVDTGTDLVDHVRWTKFSDAAWTADSKGFFYVKFPEPKEGEALKAVSENGKILYHAVGTPQEEDKVVYERPDHPQWGLYPGVTDDGRYLVIWVDTNESNNNGVFLKDLASDGPVIELLKDIDAQYWPVGNDGSVFWFVTDLDAPLRRIIAVDLANPARDAWKTIVHERAYAIEGAYVVGDRIVVHYLRRAQSQIELYQLDGSPDRSIVLPRAGSASFRSDVVGRRADRELFFAFSSFVDPPTIYRYDFDRGALAAFKRPKVEFDADRFETTQVVYQSKDGTAVTMFLTKRRNLASKKPDLPVLLEGYGGFDIAITPQFSVEDLVWMEMGGILAVPNLRGGGEYGKAWHEGGMRERKQNVFDDFIAAAESLEPNGISNPKRIAIRGGSNGGLLVGACMTQRPDLFAACLPEVGVMDMLRYHKFTIGYSWIPEYGSSDDPEMFKVLYKYSPYANLRKGTHYPATLVMTADHDDRVVPLHSFKFAARLQACQGGKAPVLIRIETKAGHGAGTPTGKLIDEATDRLSFLAKTLDVEVKRRFWRKDD
ncbi:MAG TPA: prolyl oligopeptidase family serine peptidase [Planctomycetota bacterium]|nr:prolyl oligopeptidase family serine peptidase [Planctomycetota bacterium]